MEKSLFNNNLKQKTCFHIIVSCSMAFRKLTSSFPMDFNFENKSNIIFGTGMCVAPLVAANIFHQIKLQFLDKI